MDRHAKVVPLQLHPMGFIEAFTRFGARLDALLDGTGINRGQVERGCGRISYEQQRQLVENGIRACDRPGIGLLVGMEFAWCFFGPVGYVVHCSPSLRDAAEAFRRFMAIPQPYYAMVSGSIRTTGVLETSDWFVGTVVPMPPGHGSHALSRFEIEFRLATYLRVWDLCGNRQVEDPSVHVRLGYPEPAYAALYQQLPCTSLTFGCRDTQVVVHKDFLVKPWRPYRRAAFNQLIARCEEALRRSSPRATWADSVRTYIGEAFNRAVTLEGVAERMGITPRALSRRLAEEGTNFRALLHQVRMEITIEHLRSSRLGVDEIAELMGFSCASSLRRAVKRWSGRTAGEIRGGCLELLDPPSPSPRVAPALHPRPSAARAYHAGCERPPAAAYNR